MLIYFTTKPLQVHTQAVHGHPKLTHTFFLSMHRRLRILALEIATKNWAVQFSDMEVSG